MQDKTQPLLRISSADKKLFMFKPGGEAIKDKDSEVNTLNCLESEVKTSNCLESEVKTLNCLESEVNTFNCPQLDVKAFNFRESEVKNKAYEIHQMITVCHNSFRY